MMQVGTAAAALGMCLAIAAGQGARAQELGDPERGRVLAAESCAECHAVAPGDRLSPDANAPAFAAVSEMPSATRTSLLVWLQSSHPTMPNIKLTDQEADDLIAYILDLAPR